MKSFISLLFISAISVSLHAQIGISLSYRYMNAPYWGSLLGENETIFKNGHGFHADYLIPLDGVRLDLLPEFGFTKFSNELAPVGDYPTRIFLGQFFSFQANANLYPFDFFHQISSKSNLSASQRAARSIFVQLSPGVSMVYLSYRAALEEMLLPPRQTVASIGFGTGFNLHYRNYLTLTPMIRYRHYPNVEWNGFSELRDESSGLLLRDASFVNQVAFSLRLGITWN